MDMNAFKILAIGLAAGFSGAAIFSLIGPQAPMQTSQPIQLPRVAANEVAQVPLVSNVIHKGPAQEYSALHSFAKAAQTSVGAVVHVRTAMRTRMPLNPWYEMLGYRSPEEVHQGSGSGVIIGDEGFIVTNNHVIEGADEITVSMNDNRTYKAEVIGTDPSTDLAMLKISAEFPLPFVEFGNSDQVGIGDWVLAVGNPFDLTSTVTAGIVSAKARNINLLRARPDRGVFPIESFIQTDAAVNPGNSGGALVNTRGELIGINTAIASRTGSYAGYSFAVPSTIVEKVAQDLMRYGEVQRAYLGIQIEPVTEAIAEQLDMTEIKGCAITDLVPGSGAAESGLEIGDVVLAIDGQEISDFPELQESVSRFHPGDEVKVRVWRNGEELEVLVQLKDRNGRLAIKKLGSSNSFDLTPS
jgi:Do/DeqQ family serine protease